MTTSTKKLLAGAPALVAAFAAFAFGVSALAGGTVPGVAMQPRGSDAQVTASEGLSPALTARDWQEVNGTRNRIVFR